ncbi:hypothetical protein QJS10_CPA03g00071 [Acorus calamus]|uniref:Uncharacterized protein n=1 Tax=Acorus calamus TaxID=4465 RepID=A0AAV9F9J2_ACOCL|nr:hypothetical protein QJS10_CPA03g00071 [Acorus calamus]
MNNTTANVSSSTLAGFGGPSSTLPTSILPQTFPSQAPTNFMLCDPSTDPWLGGGRVRGKSRSTE